MDKVFYAHVSSARADKDSFNVFMRELLGRRPRLGMMDYSARELVVRDAWPRASGTST